MYIRTKSPTTALSNAWVQLPMTGGSGDVPPRRYTLQNLAIWLDTIAGAASVTIMVTQDSARDKVLVSSTPSGATQSISAGGTAAKGGISINLGVVWISESTELPYIWAKLDAGTANAVGVLTGTTEGNP